MNLFVHPSKGFNSPCVDTLVSTPRITVVPTAQIRFWPSSPC